MGSHGHRTLDRADSPTELRRVLGACLEAGCGEAGRPRRGARNPVTDGDKPPSS